MSCVWMLQRGHSGDGCVLASTLCKYDLRKGDLFVLGWARVRRVRRGMLPRDNRCMYMAHVCFYVCCSDCVGVCGNVCCVAAIVKNSVFFSLGVLKYVCVGDVNDVFYVCIVRCGAVGARVCGV